MVKRRDVLCSIHNDVDGDLPFADVQMRVVIPPVIVAGRVYRVVSPVQSLIEVEEWVGEWWEPSNVTLTEAGLAPAAPAEMLRELGIPEEDCLASAPRPDQPQLEALLLTRDPKRPENMRFDEEVVRRPNAPRGRSYPGNARFRRVVTPPPEPEYDPSERRQGPSPEWTGPWRRAGDDAHMDDPSRDAAP